MSGIASATHDDVAPARARKRRGRRFKTFAQAKAWVAGLIRAYSFHAVIASGGLGLLLGVIVPSPIAGTTASATETLDHGMRTVVVTFSDGSTTTIQLPGDSAGGIAKVVPDSEDPARGMYLSGEKVFFFPNSDHIGPGGREALDRLVNLLRVFPQATVRLTGHCDQSGDTDYNTGLGYRRAAAVQAYLVTQGISMARIKVVSTGDDIGSEAEARLNRNVAPWILLRPAA